MKKVFFFSLMSLAIVACSPKNALDAAKGIGLDLVQKQFGQMVAAQNSGDISKALDFTFPKLFEQMPRQQMEAMYGQLASMGIQNLVDNVKISNLGETIRSGEYDYSKATLSSVSKLIPSDKSLIEPLAMQMGQMYDAEQIKKTAEGVEVSSTEDLYIMQDVKSKQMYFLQGGPQVAPVLEQVLPADVLSKFNP